jgi:hypothetical protein
MSRRTLISLVASVIVGIACIATISTDAFAEEKAASLAVGFITVALLVVALPALACIEVACIAVLP